MVAVIVAIFLLLALVLIALVVDRGMIYVVQSRLQNAVDAAALAAINELCVVPANQPAAEATAKSAAKTYGDRNGVTIDPGKIEVAFGSTAYVYVPATTVQNLIFGSSTVSRVAVSAQAGARKRCITNYAIFSAASVDAGGKPLFVGDVYANATVDYNGTPTFDGDVYAASGVVNKGTGNPTITGTVYSGTAVPAVSVSQVALALGLPAAIAGFETPTPPGKSITVSGDCNLGSIPTVDRPNAVSLVCTGAFKDSGSSTLLASLPKLRLIKAGTITVTGSSPYGSWPSTPIILFATGNAVPAITIGGGVEVNGYVYAPAGGVSTAGKSIVDGRIIAGGPVSAQGTTDSVNASQNEPPSSVTTNKPRLFQ